MSAVVTALQDALLRRRIGISPSWADIERLFEEAIEEIETLEDKLLEVERDLEDVECDLEEATSEGEDE